MFQLTTLACNPELNEFFEHKHCSVQKVKSKALELITALSSKQALWTTLEGGLGINYAADFIGTCVHSDITPLGVSF